MRRRILITATAVSLLLSAATAVLWVASYHRAWEIKTKGPTGPNGGIVNAIELGLDARSADGTLLIKYNMCVWDVPYWKLVTVLLYFARALGCRGTSSQSGNAVAKMSVRRVVIS